MKKLLSLSLILIIISIVSSVYAVESSCEINLQSDKDQVSKGNEFIVDVKLSNIQDAKGIFGLSAVLEYDKDSLEYKGMESQDGWEKPSYFEESGIIAILREDEYATTDQIICKITFKVKDTSKKDIKVSLMDIVASNGTKDITIGEKNVAITVMDGSVSTPTNPDIEENGTNTRIPGTNTEQNIPYAGSDNNTSLILWLGAFILLAIALFIKVKIIDRDI